MILWHWVHQTRRVLRSSLKDGRIYENGVMMKFVVRDGKIQSVSEYADLFAVLKFRGAKDSGRWVTCINIYGSRRTTKPSM